MSPLRGASIKVKIPGFFRIGCLISSWAIITALLIWAFNLKDPHFLPLRPFETPILLSLSGLGIAWYSRRPGRRGKTLPIIALAVVMLLTLTGEGLFRYHRHAVLNGDTEGTRTLGRHFVIGYLDPATVEPLITKGLIGGVFVTSRNIRGKTLEQFRDEIGELQAIRKAAGLPPLIVATDQEGGMVSRLSPPLARRPGLATLVAQEIPEAILLTRARAYGREQGRELAGVGVNVNFSPVVDLKSNRPPDPLDFHSHIASRAISTDPALTARVAQAYVSGLGEEGVLATLKHFPGLGRVTGDTHHFSATFEASPEDLAARDWVPFSSVAAGSPALIMLSHVILTRVDERNPVSFSRNVVQRIIRQGWGHDGPLITDDLTMGAAYNRGLCEATVKSLNAGVDLLLISYDFEKYYEAMYCASSAYKKGNLDKAMLNASGRRLDNMFLRNYREQRR